MAEKKPKYLHDGARDGIYVRAWSEGRGRDKEIVVQVWWKPKPEGEPDGDWGMPGSLPVAAAVEQAILQTRRDVEAKAAKTVEALKVKGVIT